MARLFADENVAVPIVGELRLLGHDVLTAREAGRANQKIADVNHLAFASKAGRGVITNDAWDYHRLHAADSNHEGIITYSFHSDFVAVARRIHTAIGTRNDLSGILIRVTRPTRP